MKPLLYIHILFFLNLVSAQEIITAAEYFIDIDPGIGNATAFSVTNGNSIAQSFNISTTGLTEGAHILHVRVKDHLDQWSLYGRQHFFIRTITTPNTKSITAAEYFFDTDPGIGNASSVSITPGLTIDDTLNIAVPNDLEDGDHYLQIRVLDDNGIWSLYARFEFEEVLGSSEFTLANFTLYPNPVTDLLYSSLDGRLIEKAILMDMNGKIVAEYSGILDHISLKNINSGLYIVQLETNKGTFSRKIIKK